MKKIFIVYIGVCALLLTNIILNIKFNISFAGFWNDRILFWLWLGFTLLILILFWKRKLTKAYFAVLIFAIILSMIPMGIPFWGMYLSVTGKGLRFEKKITSKYRIQVACYSIMTKYAPIEIIENYGIFEKEIIADNSNLQINDSLSISSWDIKDVWYISESDKAIVLKITDGNNTVVKNFEKK